MRAPFPPGTWRAIVRRPWEWRLVDGMPCRRQVATFYAVMVETEYVKKEQFNKNFWAAFSRVLGKGHVVRSLAKCDFRPIYEWHMAERERKRTLPKEVGMCCAA